MSPTSSWLRAAAVRAIRTGAQVAIATIGTAAVLSDVKWDEVSSIVVLAMILSVLTSLAGLPEAEPSPLENRVGDDG